MLEHKNLKHSYRKFISNQVSFVLKSSIKLSTGCFKLFQIQFISLFFELHFSTFDVYELSFNGGLATIEFQKTDLSGNTRFSTLLFKCESESD